MTTRPIRAEAHVDVPFEPDRLWPFVADTNRMDRAVGLPPASFSRVERSEGGEHNLGEYRILGALMARWVEHPFEWERPRRFAVLREYDLGPISRFYGGTELTPRGDGAHVHVFAEFTPRLPVFDPLVRFLIAPLTITRARRQHEAIASFLAGAGAPAFPTLAASRSRANDDALTLAMARLLRDGAPEHAVHALERLLRVAADEEVYGMRPLELADSWGLDRAQTLETFLRATVVGLLEMRWELLCAGCRGVKAGAAHLGDLPANAYCPACAMHVTARIDEAIESRFYPAPAIRKVSLGTYCIGGPMSTPHRIAQTTIPPVQTREWRLTLAPGPYLIRSPQSRGGLRLDVEHGCSAAELDVRVEATSMSPEAAHLAAGPITMRVSSASTHPVTVALDDARWSDSAATPSRLMMSPAFRDLFSAEALAPGVELAVAGVGLLFTDLAGSTALYERAGEARAFRLVSDHFDVVRVSIEAAGGTVVKTIGDAVMAAFPDGRAALDGALAIQRNIRALNADGLVEVERLVKVGVHAGPCFVVTLNERLDYFGTTVNVAARAEREAQGGQVVTTASVYEESRDLLDAHRLLAEPMDLQLKGLSTPVRLYRIDPTLAPSLPTRP